MRKLVGIIQARMGSKRVPGKVMIRLKSKPIIQHIKEGLEKSYDFEKIILATTSDTKNDEMCNFAKDYLNIDVYREDSENDICARLHKSIKDSKDIDGIVKINADCPILDTKVVNEIATKFATSKVDYVSNKFEWTYPKGLSCEAISINSLKWCFENLTDEIDRELVCDYIKNSDGFTKLDIRSTHQLGHRNWMLDVPEELKILNDIFENYHDGPFDYLELEHYLTTKYGKNYEW